MEPEPSTKATFLKIRDWIFAILAFLCGLAFCTRDYFLHKHCPLMESDEVQWNAAQDLSQNFYAGIIAIICVLAAYFGRQYKIFSFVISVFVGISLSDIADRVHHIINSKYKIDRITLEDIAIMLITVLLSLYQYKYGNRKNNRPVKST